MADKKYLDASLPEAERVELLLKQMTLDEKLAQIAMGPSLSDMKKQIDEGTYPELGYPTSYTYDAEQMALYNEVQKYQLEHTRLGIPLLLHGESLHGFMCHGATVFPQPLALGATFDDELVGCIADVAGHEAYVNGVRQTYAPNLDISRDPRWGRVEENYGEDPYLTSRMAYAYVTNLQKNKVASSPKHYVAHGTPESGINIGPVHAGEREMREVMLEPFAAAFTAARAMSVMPAYSELDGIPIHASHYIMTDILRGELGFDGYAVSDFGAIPMMWSFHHIAETPCEAGVIALNAGIDHEAGARYSFNEEFCNKIRNGEIDIAVVDEAVRRTLRVKFRLGLFDDPYAKPDAAKSEMRTEASKALARRAGREAPVLLENNGLLPLDKAACGRVALIGPNADYARHGNYCAPRAEAYSVTLRDGLNAAIGEDRVIYAKGSHIGKRDDKLLDEAYAAAMAADTVVIALGDSSCYHGSKYWGDEEGGNVVTCGEGFDSHDLMLPPAQIELLKKVAEAKKPTVLLMMCGRPYTMGELTPLADATLYTWYPGEQGGHAICDLLFGDYSPSGRLPISFPRSVGHIPCYYNHKTSARGIYHKPGSYEQSGRDYVFSTPGALYPFGYGLSYTTFEYSDLTCEGDKVRVTVENTGRYDADETVMLFVRQLTSPVTPFVKRLRHFSRVPLKAGEKKTVEFTLCDADFTYIDANMKKAVNYGKCRLYVKELTCDIEVNDRIGKNASDAAYESGEDALMKLLPN